MADSENSARPHRSKKSSAATSASTAPLGLPEKSLHTGSGLTPAEEALLEERPAPAHTSLSDLQMVVEHLCGIVQPLVDAASSSAVDTTTRGTVDGGTGVSGQDVEDLVSDEEVDEDLPVISFVDSSKTSGAVHEGLATIINRAFTSATVKADLDLLMDRYCRPSNCEELVVPTINSEIWRMLPKSTKFDDVALQRAQSMLIGSSSAIATAFTDLKSLGDSATKSILRKLGDAVLLQCSAAFAISLKRRDFIKPLLKPELRSQRR